MYWRRWFICFLCLMVMTLDCAAQTQGTGLSGFSIQKNDRVVVYGDSISAGAKYLNYTRYLEAYLRTRFPDRKNLFWNRSWSGDTAGNLDRFKRDCLPLKPDVLLINMGVNDTGWKPQIAPGLRRFVTHLTQMVELARKANPKVKIWLVSPILWETKSQGTHAFLPYVLWSYSREEKKLAKKLQVNFIDLTQAYGQTLGLAEMIFPQTLIFSGEGIHPTPLGGSLFIAKHLLKGLNAPSELASMSIDAQKGRVVSTLGQRVKLIHTKTDELVFERTLDALPWPVIGSDQGLTYMDQAVAFLVSVAEDLNRDTLQVTGLKGKSYSLSVDGQKVASLSAEELSDGVNLSRFYHTPDQKHALNVCDAVAKKQVLQFDHWRASLQKANHKKNKDTFDQAIKDARQTLFALSQPKKHRFVLMPLDQPVDRFERYEQNLLVTGPLTMPVGDGIKASRTIKIQVKNLSPVSRYVQLFWTRGTVEPRAVSVELSARQEREFSFDMMLHPNDSAPLLRVKHLPADHSFPALLQQFSPVLIPIRNVPRTKDTVKVDGDLSDWHTFAYLNMDARMMQAILTRRQGEEDFSVKARLMWDEKNLYLGVIVRDQDYTNHFTQSRIGWDDAVNVMIASKRFSLAQTNQGAKIWPADVLKKGGHMAVRYVSGGLCYEVSIPWSLLSSKKPKVDALYDFNLTVSDRDRDESYKAVNWCGSLEFSRHGKIRLSDR